MSYKKMRKTAPLAIDLDRAVDLWREHHHWPTVASVMLRPDGTAYTPAAIYSALRRADRLPEDAKQRPTNVRDMREANIGHWWTPGKEKWLPRRPCYRTNTVVDNDPDLIG